MALSKRKGKDYANVEDIAANFKRVADIARVTRVDQLMNKPYGYALFMTLMKIDRFINLELSGAAPANEAVVDTWDDAKNYLDFAESTWLESRGAFAPKPDTLEKETISTIPPDLIPMLGPPAADTLRKTQRNWSREIDDAMLLSEIPRCEWCGERCPMCEATIREEGFFRLDKSAKVTLELPEQTEITAGLIDDYEMLSDLIKTWITLAKTPEMNEAQRGALYKRILSAARARTDIGAILLARGVKAAPKEKDASQVIAKIVAAREKKNAGNAPRTP